MLSEEYPTEGDRIISELTAPPILGVAAVSFPAFITIRRSFGS